MKFTIDIPKETVKQLSDLVSEWRKLSPWPLTNFERLRQIEKEISSQFTYVILSNDALDTFIIAE